MKFVGWEISRRKTDHLKQNLYRISISDRLTAQEIIRNGLWLDAPNLITTQMHRELALARKRDMR